MSRPRLPSLVGERFGRLVVVEIDGRDQRYRSYWACTCDCGDSRVVRDDILRSGCALSCGCIRAGVLQRPARVERLSIATVEEHW